MSMLFDLENPDLWNEFLEYKNSKGHLSKEEYKKLEQFIKDKNYLPIVHNLKVGHTFNYPQLKMVNKNHSSKKRIVFTFDTDENFVLKMLGYMLGNYDYIFKDNLYSFRKNKSVKQAIDTIVNTKNIKSMFSYKVDIKDYFNSADTVVISHLLKKHISNDDLLTNFIISLLETPFCFYETQKIKCHKGIMAGVPISGFLADLYLTQMDSWFAKKNVLYIRYSDDIIVFGKSKDEIEIYKEKIKYFLSKFKLCINTEKEANYEPGEKWEYLGFLFDNGKTDISSIAIDKIKAKIKRKARSILRWKTNKNASDTQAIRAFIKHFNKKFYLNPIHNELTWCRWYFPVINTSKSLKEIDAYMIKYIRYIKTGKHTKANYNLRYDIIKDLGFKSLVNEFHKFKRKVAKPKSLDL